MDYAILSPLETLPSEVTNKIFGWLKKSPWKLPLGQCSKRLYGVFVSHIEKRKGDILKSYRCMRYAAIWGDPILTQIPLNYNTFNKITYIDVCISGNLELTKYIDAYLVSIAQTSNKKELNLGKQVEYWHLEALKMLLRLNTCSRFVSISIERLDEFIRYFFEELKGPKKDKLILCLSGTIEVYGKETCLFPMFKDYMLRYNDDFNKQRRIRTFIKEEYFYLGDIEKAQTIECPFYNFNCDMPRDKAVMESILNCETIHIKCLKNALRSPKQNTEAITVAWNEYTSYGDDRGFEIGIEHSMRINFWPIAIDHHKSKIFYKLTHEYLKDHDIDLDYYRLWIYNFRASQSHIELWNLDPKTCLIRILSECYAKEYVSFKCYDAFKRLLKYYPDIMNELSLEQRNVYQNLGLFCPRCLKRIIRQHTVVNKNPYCRYCRYCKYNFLSMTISKKS